VPIISGVAGGGTKRNSRTSATGTTTTIANSQITT
jgi:hypothetical protein